MNQHLRPENIHFIDVAAQRRRLGPAIEQAVARVLAHCQFVNGPEVMALEAALAAFCGAKHVVTCASGTDALIMVLMAKRVGPDQFQAPEDGVAGEAAAPAPMPPEAGTAVTCAASAPAAVACRTSSATNSGAGASASPLIAACLYWPARVIRHFSAGPPMFVVVGQTS